MTKEQKKRLDLDSDNQLVDGESAPWLTQLGGLVPLLVAYEEQIKAGYPFSSEFIHLYMYISTHSHSQEKSFNHSNFVESW